MAIKEALQGLWRQIDPSAIGLRLPRRLRIEDALDSILFARSEPPPPAKSELEALKRKVEQAIGRGQFEDLDERDLLLLPCILFVTTPAFGDDPGLLNYCERAYSNEPKRIVIQRLIKAYRDGFAPDRESTRRIARMIFRGFDRLGPNQLVGWQELHAKIAYFEPRIAPGELAGAFLKADDELDGFVNRFSLDSPTSPMSFAVFNEALTNLGRVLKTSADPLATLHRVLLWVRDGERLRFDFPVTRTAIADEMLTPFAGQEPSAATQEELVRFFLRFYGHPRERPGSWSGVSDTARSVFLAWLAKRAIERFFFVLDKASPEEQWAYRKRFWMAYVSAGLITDAWPVFGKVADQFAANMLKDDRGATERYGHLEGASYEQSVLIMTLADMTIVEWSNNGRCWGLSQASEEKPRVGGSFYNAAALRGFGKPLFAVVHSGKTTGSWQGEVAEQIRLRTGIRAPKGAF